MTFHTNFRAATIALAALALSGCSGGLASGDSGLFKRTSPAPTENIERQRQNTPLADDERSTIWGLFENKDDPNVTIEVNKYLWNASLEVLNFLPVQSVDPFSGVIITGFGTPPGGGSAYRATIYVQDPALDARSLKVALATRSGPASASTVRAVEDAILTRARQLRIRDGQL
ncbi:DUF3576 domain-containing protein [Actibacterium lipolyticum]|uniref:DUF3576 domain-containing protein n=1 Tax=Actibacterium lipolyticum TaxID=1524263 RepID=A0A238KU58_9RHOB|nr:DUF3576 domain-containing protein [Actibacterium lipolyticum]SMX46345.1 hypothetical protein COL8621_03069 [Actibacterium lipolyticum]